MRLPEVKIARNVGIHSNDALIVVDVQKDFMPSGALPVVEGDLVVPGINKLIAEFRTAANSIVLTQDWHTPDHQSFASAHRGKKPYEQFSSEGVGPILWPDHCVRGTLGAEFHRDLNTEAARLIIRKGTNPRIDSYSAFIENDKKTETGLSGYLRTIGVKRVFLCGLALDYCVFYTAVDGKKLGFDVVLIIDLTRPVGAPEGTVTHALEEMTSKEIIFTNANQIRK